MSKKLPKELAKIVGINIKKFRDERRWSQQKLARFLGYKNASNVTILEKGARLPSWKILDKLAHIFGVEVSIFFENQNEKTKNFKAQKYEHIEKEILRLAESVLGEEHLFRILGICHPKLQTFFRLAKDFDERKIDSMLNALPAEFFT